jgi:hypothetical protein
LKRTSAVALFALALLEAPAIAQANGSGDIAMITSVQGGVTRVAAPAPVPAVAFVKLKRGDRLTLSGARLQIVYFDNGRQELWQGNGKLEIGDAASRAAGLPEPAVKTLPEIMVKQIARTPALDSQGRAGVVRLRSITTSAAVDKLDANYRRLREDAAPEDLNPDLYLLSGLFELREFERIERVLADLRQKRPGNAEVDQVIGLYQKALKEAH